MERINASMDKAKEDDADPLKIIRALKSDLRDILKPEWQRKREALAAEIAARQAELSKLEPTDQ
jgi:hypothetical protein